MKQLILLFTLSVSLTAFAQQSDADRKKYFPKQSVSVDEFPDREKVWVFIMAGQSNMAGRGQVMPDDTLTSERIITVNKENEWILAKEPLHPYEPIRTGLDCGVSFARTLQEQVPDDVTIAMIPCAIGGSAMHQWLGDSLYRGVHLYTNFEEKLQVAREKGIVKGIIWHQGESDAHADKIPKYQDSIHELFTRFRASIEDDDLPIIMGQLGDFADPETRQPNWNVINALMRDYVSNHPNMYIISTAGLSCKDDYIHFTAESQRKIGRRFAEKYLSIHGK